MKYKSFKNHSNYSKSFNNGNEYSPYLLLILFIIQLNLISIPSFSEELPLFPKASEKFQPNQIQWINPPGVGNPVFTSNHGNNHDPILFVDTDQEYPYHLLISHEKGGAHLWKTKSYSWTHSHWQLVSNKYVIDPRRYEFDDGIKVKNTYYVYEGGIVYTYSGSLSKGNGKWEKGGHFPDYQCNDLGVYHENGVFHIFGEYGGGAKTTNGTSISHFTSETGLGQWNLQDTKVINPDRIGRKKAIVGDPTITKINNQYYIYLDQKRPGNPYSITGWVSSELSGPFEFIGEIIEPRIEESDDWYNYRVQDPEIKYIPYLSKFVLLFNMMDRDGIPGGHFPSLKNKNTRVIGTVYSSDHSPSS